MRWQGRRRSTRVEDRRGAGPMVRRGAPIGCGGLLLLLVFAYLTGQNPLALLQSVEQGGGAPAGYQEAPAGAPSDAPSDELGEFASVVLADTEDTWSEIFAQRGVRYRLPTLVLFSGAVQSACGFNSAAVGPFYCPPDQKVYIDLSFFDQLENRLGAPGDFAQAYVLAHEVGHHVQNLLGISEQVRRQQAALPQAEANELSVRLELQADCLAGVWGFHARDLLEPGDVEEGLRAAGAIGDDVLSGGRIRPESWTHGSAAQRTRWLRRGLESGDPDACDTFDGRV